VTSHREGLGLARLSGGARVTFLGDTLVGGEAQPVLDERGASWMFDGIRHLLAGSDLVVVNHEGPITSREEPARKLITGRKRYWYRAQPAAVAALTKEGIRVVSLGNNHVLDFGPEGLADTIAALDAAGIAHCGAGPTRRAARRPAIVEAGSLRFGFLSFMQTYKIYVAEELYAARDRPGSMRLSVKRAKADLAALVSRVDVCVALAHWGRNYRGPNGRQRRLASELVAGRADLVIGHHPHVPHPVSLVEGVPVCYSLGNGPLGTPGRFHSGRKPYGLVVSFDFEAAAEIRRIAVTAIFVDNAAVGFRPRVAEGDEARRVLRKLLPTELDWTQDAGGGFSAELHHGSVRKPIRLGSSSQQAQSQ
jgi:poly-gamma-glutamate capsule biosynthesis protein CapA/YwtB (metallophosphatase superfamily)